MTIEELDKLYEGNYDDIDYLELQARLGDEFEKSSAYDENGNFHCIKWFDCNFCPAFNPKHCL